MPAETCEQCGRTVWHANMIDDPAGAKADDTRCARVRGYAQRWGCVERQVARQQAEIARLTAALAEATKPRWVVVPGNNAAAKGWLAVHGQSGLLLLTLPVMPDKDRLKWRWRWPYDARWSAWMSLDEAKAAAVEAWNANQARVAAAREKAAENACGVEAKDADL